VLSFVQQHGNSVLPVTSNSAPVVSSKYEITVEGIRFQVTKQGSKLVRAPGEFIVLSPFLYPLKSSQMTETLHPQHRGSFP
jgi:hypothetical protein